MRAALFSLGLLFAGCAANPSPRDANRAARYEDAESSALVFDLPMDRGMQHPELARASREQTAFLGFDTPATESYITATDTISTEQGDFHIQESVVVKSGVRTR